MPTPVEVFNGEQLLIQLESAPGSGVFDHDCLINTTRGIKFSANVITSVIPTCETPEDPAWNSTEKDGLGAAIDGAGKVHLSSVTKWFNFFKNKDTINIKVKVNKVGGVTWTGAYHCMQFDVSGTRKEKADAVVALVSDGEVTIADNA
jgi:hypothetical protein